MGSVNTGRLEAFSGNEWGTVCKSGWVKPNGIVACRELGFPGLKFSMGDINFVPPGSGKITYNNVGCIGDESQLSKCLNNFGEWPEDCSHYYDMALVCNKSNYVFFNLWNIQSLSKRLSKANIYKYINIGHMTNRKIRISVGI